MIQLQDVSRTYASDEVETTALGGIDLHIERGSSSPSWAHRAAASRPCSTSSAHRRPSGGRYLFEGDDIAKARRAELARLRRDRLGFVFQSFKLIDELTIAENVALASPIGRCPRARRRSGSPRRWIASALPTASATTRTSCRVASSSAPPSPARSLASRA